MLAGLEASSEQLCDFFQDMMYDTPFMKSEDSRGSLHGKRRNYSPSLPYEMKVPDFSSEVKVESSYQNEDENMMKLKLHVSY